MKILWIGGWAISTNTLRSIVATAFPKVDHCCIHPHERFLESIEDYNPDIIVGYSLGASLLLMNDISRYSRQYLIAPFFNIKDATWVSSTQLKYLLRWMKHDPISAINDFYERAGLTIPKVNELPYSLTDLIWGIETLIKVNAVSIYDDRYIFLGKQDPLINRSFFMKNVLKSVTCLDADHNLQNYLYKLSF